MRKLEVLYALDKKGKIREYHVQYESQSDGTWVVSTAAGLLDGRKTVNHTVIRKGLQGRTIEGQAELKANSKWNDKMDEGYKSYKTLRTAHLARHPEDDEVFGLYDGDLMLPETIETLFEKMGLRWNTSSLWTPLPMLAEPWKKVRNPTFPYIAQRKLNGVRCLAMKNESRVLLCSRGGQLYTSLSHIENEVGIILKKYNIMLDGEIYLHGMNLNQISGIVRTEKQDKIDMFATKLEYHVYDIPYGSDSSSQFDREAFRKQLSKEFNYLHYIRFVDSAMVHSKGAAKALHDQFVEEQYEGLILRKLDAPYMFSFRDTCLIKFKAFFDDEYEVVDVNLNKPGDISSIVFHLKDKNGTPFKSRPKGNHELWQKYLDNPPYSKMATVRYIALSDVNKVPSHSNVLVMRDYE